MIFTLEFQFAEYLNSDFLIFEDWMS